MRNLTARPLVAVMQLVLVALVCTIAVSSETQALSDTVDEQETRIREGTNIAVAKRGDDGTLTASDCEALRRFSGVMRVGWARETGPLELTQLPGRRFRSFEISAGLARMFDDRQVVGSRRSSEGDTIYIGMQAVNELGGVLPEVLAGRGLGRGYKGNQISAIPDLPFLRNYSRSVAVVGYTPTVVDVCYVEWEDHVDSERIGWTRSLIGRLAAETVTAASTRDDPFAQKFNDRASRFSWLIGAAFMALVMLLVGWFSRRDTALYRSLGLTVPNLLFMTSVYRLAILVLGGVLGVALTGLSGGPIARESAITLQMWHATRVLSAALILSILDPLLWRSSQLVRHLKE